MGKLYCRRYVKILGWDEPLSVRNHRDWEGWYSDLRSLGDLQALCSVRPGNTTGLLGFCDAPEVCHSVVVRAYFCTASVSKSFSKFVENGITTIHNSTPPDNWRPVKSEAKPARSVSRGTCNQGDMEGWFLVLPL
ncbi:hypothetical protein PHET_11734 [Paragonimus heterotremus]|uniref:Uncharacterized protein n=1 Tax=Paragonimus heterotremus TaxID=100268 RepID=A0A8J4SIL9_9TREM|nr:hypothetical protein PHET_11734 [Paragonimus heterotremus]